MISRIILCAAMGGFGLNGLFPDPPKEPQPLNAAQLHAKAKQRSMSNICNGKKKSKTVKEMCQRWEKHNA